MILLLDIGNTNVKWATLATGQIVLGGSSPHRGLHLASLWSQLWHELAVPQRVVVASVAGADVAASLTTWVSSIWGLQPEFRRAVRQECGLRSGYQRPEQLGIDRWMAMIGARQLPELDGSPVCVVGCGTALTLDVISANGEHLGGWIAPGIHMMHQALRSGTAALGTTIESGVATDRFGSCTEQAVGAGVLHAASGVVNQALLLAQRILGVSPACVVSGGGAGELLPLLSQDAIHMDHLVLRGLAASILLQEVG